MADSMDTDEDPVSLQQWAREQFGEAFLNGGQATDKDILSLMAFSHKRWAQVRFRFFGDHQRGDPTFGVDIIPGISQAALDIRESANAMIHQANILDDLVNTRIQQPTYTHLYRNQPMPTADEYTRIRSTLFGISYRLTMEEAWVIASIGLRPDERVFRTFPAYMRDTAIPFLNDVSTYMVQLKETNYQMKTKNDYSYENEYATHVYPAWDQYNNLLVECVTACQRLLKVTPRAVPGDGEDWRELSKRIINQLIVQKDAVINAITRTARFQDVKKKLKAENFPFKWSNNKPFDTDNSLIPTLDQLPDLPAQRVAPWQKTDLAFGLTEFGAHTLRAAAEARGGPPLGTLGPDLGDPTGPAGQSYANGVGHEGADDAWDYKSTTLGRHIKGIYWLTPQDRSKRTRRVQEIRDKRAEELRQGGGNGGAGGTAATLGQGFVGAGNGGGNGGGNNNNNNNNNNNRGGRGGGPRPNGTGGTRGNHRTNGAAGANRNGGQGGPGGRRRTDDDNNGARNTRRRTGNAWQNMVQVANVARTRAVRVAHIGMDSAYSSFYERRAAAPAVEGRGSGTSWEELERRELEAQGISYDGGYDYGYDEEDYDEEDEEDEEEEEDEDDMAQFVRLHGRPRGITRTVAAEDSVAERKRLADEIGLVSSLAKRRRI